MREIAIINQKGGVGKTTTCCNVGAALAAAGQRVLLIDLDPQAHLTMHLGIEPAEDRPSIYNILTDSLPIAEAMVRVSDTLHVVPSHIDLAAAEMELISVMGREVILRDALQSMETDYDFVLIDCPPSLGVLTINGLVAMREVIVPMQPHFLALQGVGKLLETIRLVKDRINEELVVTGIVLCMYDAGTRLAGEVSADLSQFIEASRGTDVPWANACVFKTIIRRNIKLAECPSHGLAIADYAPSSNGAADYASLAAEVLGVDELAVMPLKAAVEEKAAPSASEPVAAEQVDGPHGGPYEGALSSKPGVHGDEGGPHGGPYDGDGDTGGPHGGPYVDVPVVVADEPAPVFEVDGRVAYGPDDSIEPETEHFDSTSQHAEPAGQHSEPSEQQGYDKPDHPVTETEAGDASEPVETQPRVNRLSIPIQYEEDSGLAGPTSSEAHHG